MDPLFSIIIPTHNRAELLKKAIQSVVNQIFDDWELIIVDDGSVDPTRSIVEKIVNEKIHYFYQKNKERSSARNLGIKNAKGKYICFLDDDDYFLPNHLEVITSRIKKENYSIGIFRTGMIIKKGNKETHSLFFDSKKFNHPIPFFLKHMVGIHTLCFHRKILERHTFDERWMHFQDTHLFILCLLEFPFFQITNHTVVYMQYQGMGSISIFKMATAEKRTENNVNAIKDLFLQGGAKLLKYVSPHTENQLVADKYLSHAHGALQVGKKKLAMNYINKSMKVNRGKKFSLKYLKFYLKYFFNS